MWPSYKGRMGDVLASGGDEGRGSLRKARGSRQTDDDPEIPELGRREYIATFRLTQGTETSQYLVEEKEKSISLVAASESETAQTAGVSPAGL
jgi:hypothetical protein